MVRDGMDPDKPSARLALPPRHLRTGHAPARSSGAPTPPSARPRTEAMRPVSVCARPSSAVVRRPVRRC